LMLKRKLLAGNRILIVLPVAIHFIDRKPSSCNR
jgi:hypothetical protein